MNTSTSILNNAIIALLPEFEKIFQRINSKDFGTFGVVKMECHSERILAETQIPKSTNLPYEERKGDDGYTNPYFTVGFNIPSLCEPLSFCVIDDNINGKKMWVSTWWSGNIEMGAKFDHDDSENHPFVLSWQRFLDKNDYNKDLSGFNGSCNFEFLDINDGMELLEKWLSWVEKYS